MALKAVEFHTGVQDPIGFAVRLLGKAYRQDARVLVTGAPATLQKLSHQLWLTPEREFLAHVLVEYCKPEQLARSPVWLATQQAVRADEPCIVLNLGGAVPADLTRLERLIEVVGSEAEDAAAGRQRWRSYKSLGLQLQHLTGGDKSTISDPV